MSDYPRWKDTAASKNPVPLVAVALAVLLICAMVSGGAFDRLRGTVVAKEFVPAHTDNMYSPIIVDKQVIPRWIPIHHPARWEITVRSERGWDWKREGGGYEVGDSYP